jgi:hypothetical protein
VRFCPFCSAENADELAVCQACGRRLPPLPPRRGVRNAPPTGVQLPPRQTKAPPVAEGPRASGLGPRPEQSGTMPPTGPQAGMPPTGPQAAMPPTGPQAAIPTGPQVTLPGVQIPTGPQAAMPPTGPQVTLPGQIPTGPQGAIPTGPQANIPTGPQTGLPPTGRQSAIPTATQPGLTPARPRSPSDPRSPKPEARSPNSDLLNAISPGPAAERVTAPPATPDPRVVADRRGRNDSKPPTMSSVQPVPSVPAARPRTPSAPPPHPMSGPGPGPGPQPSFPPRPPVLPAHHDDFNTNMDAPIIDPAFVRDDTGTGPPPTRIQRADVGDRPFTPPAVLPVPEIPEPGLLNAARYTYQFARARWQRGGARKQLGLDIKQDTEALDQVLGQLGRAARGARVEGRVFSAENAAINEAEGRIGQFQNDHGELEARKVEENSKFIEVERERNEKLVEAERMLDEAQRELSHLEGQRRSLRDKRKEIERRQKAYLKAAEDNDKQAGTTQLGDQRQELRRAAEGNRKEAAALEPERQEIDRRLGALERPINEATAKLDAAKAELDAAKRSLNDAREGHSHRLDEIDAEQKRKAREIALAEGEIARRLVTLGTLVNLNRIEDPQFSELYLRIDRLRTAITARTTEIERLTAEREAYDRGTLVRGLATIGGAFVALIALIVILLAVI